MGYPMTYGRLVNRWGLTGGYDEGRTADIRAIAGDMRRLETDSRDEQGLAWIAEKAGVTPEQAKAVLDAFFDGDTWHPTPKNRPPWKPPAPA